MNLNYRAAVFCLNPIIAVGMALNLWISCQAILRLNKYQNAVPNLDQESFLALLKATGEAWQTSATVSVLGIFLATLNMIYFVKQSKPS
jgi:hypothetical protein